jgi:hypothetical protein
MRMPKNSAACLLLLAAGAGCSSSTSTYIWEKMGYKKRDILVSRVEDVRDDQTAAKKQFASTLDQFKALTGYSGGDLEKEYNKLKASYDKCQTRANAVRTKVAAVDEVAQKMFAEWQTNLGDYSDPDLRASSEKQLNESREKYAQLRAAMLKSSASMDPVLKEYKDHVHYLNDCLNANAISSLAGVSAGVDTDVQSLIADMDESINEANAFIDSLPKK